MNCKIERFAGLATGIAGWFVALDWMLSSPHGATVVVAGGLIVTTSLVAASVYAHARFRGSSSVTGCWAGSVVLVVYGLAVGGLGLVLVALALFTSVLAALLHRGNAVCGARPAPPPVERAHSAP